MTLAEVPTSDLLRELARRNIPHSIPPRIYSITDTVADVFGVSTANLFEDCRLLSVTHARFAVWLVLELSGIPIPSMATAFGKRDEGTIIHGLQRGRELIETTKGYDRRMKEAMDRLNLPKA